MLELLILYALNKNDNTLYGLKKEISTHYGEVSIPSHGALFPALKRLEEKNLVHLRKKLSDGGKKYTYYSLGENTEDYFNKKFMEFNNAKSETLDSFFVWLKIRLITIDALNKDLINEFKEKSLLKLNLYKEEIAKKLDNEYLELTELQKNILKLYSNEIDNYNSLIQNVL